MADRAERAIEKVISAVKEMNLLAGVRDQDSTLATILLREAEAILSEPATPTVAPVADYTDMLGAIHGVARGATANTAAPSPAVTEVEAARTQCECGHFLDLHSERGCEVEVDRWGLLCACGRVRRTKPEPTPTGTVPVDSEQGVPLGRWDALTFGDTGAACYDCGRKYGDQYGFPDLVVPHDVWNNVISPTGHDGGLLCPSCMCRRAHKAGVQCEAVFRSGPFARPEIVTPPAPSSPTRGDVPHGATDVLERLDAVTQAGMRGSAKEAWKKLSRDAAVRIRQLEAERNLLRSRVAALQEAEKREAFLSGFGAGTLKAHWQPKPGGFDEPPPSADEAFQRYLASRPHAEERE